MIFGGAIVTAGMFAMLGLGIRRHAANSAASLPPSRLALTVPHIGGSNPAAMNRQIAMTPDGSAVVFITGTESGENALAIQRLDEDAARLLSGADADLSSDIVARDGGPARNNSLLSRLRPDDRTLPTGTVIDGGRFQQMLRGDNAIVVRGNGNAPGPAVVRDLASGKESILVAGPVVEARVGAGHIVFVKPDGTLWAAPFDEKTKKLTAPAQQIGRGVSITNNGIAQFAVSRNGNVAFVPQEPRWLVFVDRAGRLRNATSERGNYHAPQFSPDGRTVSFDLIGSDGRDVWTLDRETQSLTRATFTRDAQDATWTPDGRSITFTSFTSGSLGIFRATPGLRDADSVFASAMIDYTGTWLPDSSGIITTATNLRAGSGSDIGLIANRGRGPVEAIIDDRWNASQPAVSPDGRWLAFVSDKSGASEVYVRPLKGTGDDIRISSSGGTAPVWAPDGREIFYRGSNGRYPVLIAASLSMSPKFEVEDWSALFPVGEIAEATTQANYDVAPDGRTFVMVRVAPSSSIRVLRNVPAMLRNSSRK